jgi:DNA mismatch endonuclease (patch repair protein)
MIKERTSIVRQKNIAPELAVQTVADEMGMKYNLHWADLPGTPDLVFPLQHLAVFVNGCYGHSCPRCAPEPQTNTEFRRRKISGNVQRDASNIEALRRQGWDLRVIWECQVKDTIEVRRALEEKLIADCVTS